MLPRRAQQALVGRGRLHAGRRRHVVGGLRPARRGQMQMHPHAREHFLRMEGLADEVHRAVGQPLDPAVHVVVGAQEEQRHLARRRVRLEQPAQREAVHVGQPDVQQRQVRCQALRLLQRRAAALGESQPVERMQQRGQPAQVLGLVVHQQQQGAMDRGSGRGTGHGRDCPGPPSAARTQGPVPWARGVQTAHLGGRSRGGKTIGNGHGLTPSVGLERIAKHRRRIDRTPDRRRTG